MLLTGGIVQDLDCMTRGTINGATRRRLAILLDDSFHCFTVRTTRSSDEKIWKENEPRIMVHEAPKIFESFLGRSSIPKNIVQFS